MAVFVGVNLGFLCPLEAQFVGLLPLRWGKRISLSSLPPLDRSLFRCGNGSSNEKEGLNLFEACLYDARFSKAYQQRSQLRGLR